MGQIDKGRIDEAVATRESAPSSSPVVVRVDDSASGDAWAMTEARSEQGPAVPPSAADAFLRELAATTLHEDSVTEPDRTGQRVSHYEVVEKIGQGGMGIVYAANDVRLRRKVALKVLPMRLVADDDRRRRFLREARSASAVHHPNVATVFDVGESDGAVYLAMEYVDGLTLRELLLREGGRLETIRALQLMMQVSVALARAHEAGIVHRDVKPENIMIARDGTVKVLDFGLAKLAGSDEEGQATADASSVEEFASRSGHVLGTPAYMSPEQAVGCTVDQRTDVYAIGVVLYEMLTGTRPSRVARQPLAGAGSRIAPPIARIIDRCLRPSPDERYPNAGTLREDLARVIDTMAAGKGRRAWPFVAAGAVATLGIAVWAGQGAAPETSAEAASSQAPSEPSTAAAPAAPEATATTQAPDNATAASPTPSTSASAVPSAPTRPPPSPPSPARAKPRVRDPLEQQK